MIMVRGSTVQPSHDETSACMYVIWCSRTGRNTGGLARHCSRYGHSQIPKLRMDFRTGHSLKTTLHNCAQIRTITNIALVDE